MALSNAPKVLFLDTIKLAKSQLSSFSKIANVIVRPMFLDLELALLMKSSQTPAKREKSSFMISVQNTRMSLAFTGTLKLLSLSK